MSNAATKAALNKIAEGIYELADAMFAETATGATTTAQEPSPFVDLPDEVFAGPGGPAAQPPRTVDSDLAAGALAICPKHRIPYTDGTYGLYCKSATDDPAWGKQKGDRLWCRITPKNAAEYLRITAAA